MKIFVSIKYENKVYKTPYARIKTCSNGGVQFLIMDENNKWKSVKGFDTKISIVESTKSSYTNKFISKIKSYSNPKCIMVDLKKIFCLASN